MEHNDIKARAAKGASSQPEFLRLKLAPAQNRDWSLGVTTVGSTTTTVTKASLAKHVRRTPERAVFIEGIPKIKDAAKSRGASCGSGRDDELHMDVPKAAGRGRQPVFQGLKRVLGSGHTKPRKVHVLTVKVSETLEDDGRGVAW